MTHLNCRIIAFILAITLAFQGNGFALPAGPVSPPSEITAPSFSQISIPRAFGEIKEKFEGKTGKIVFVIQDAHAIPEAQRNIDQLIRHFQTQYGTRLVALEGAASELDPQIFKSFPDQELLRKVFEPYFDRGELSGGTAASIFGGPGQFLGIEDWNLYEEGLKYVLEAMTQEKELLREVEGRRQRVEWEKKKLYSKKLFEIDQALQGFNRDATDFISALEKLDAVQPPEFSSELALLLKDARNDENQAQTQEVRKIAERIQPHLSKTDLFQLNQKLQELQTSRLSAENFAIFLKSLTREYKIPLRISEKLQTQVKHQKRLHDIEGTELFESFERYAQSVKDKLFRNNQEKALDAASHELDLLQKLVKLELSRKDWERLNGRKGEWVKGRKFESHFSFYRNAEQREQEMSKNLIKFFSHSSTHPFTHSAILVAGGFHAQGITQQLRDQGISYMLVMPQISNVPLQTHYRDHLKGDVSWKKYFEIKNNKVNLYEAFVRGMRDQLLKAEGGRSKAEGFVAKQWRDQIIRDLAAKNKIENAGNYTKFIDEMGLSSNLNKKWQANIIRFTTGLRQLKAENRITEQNIAQLLQPSLIPDLTAISLAQNKLQKDLIPSMQKDRLEIRQTPENTIDPVIKTHLEARPESRNIFKVISGAFLSPLQMGAKFIEKKKEKKEKKREVSKAKGRQPVPGKPGYSYRFFDKKKNAKPFMDQLRESVSKAHEIAKGKGGEDKAEWDRALEVSYRLGEGSLAWIIFHDGKPIAAFSVDYYSLHHEIKKYFERNLSSLQGMMTPRGNILVHPDHQKQGLGTFLYEQMLDFFLLPRGVRYYFIPIHNPASFKAFYKSVQAKKISIYHLYPFGEFIWGHGFIADFHPEEGRVPPLFGRAITPEAAERIQWKEAEPRAEMRTATADPEEKIRFLMDHLSGKNHSKYWGLQGFEKLTYLYTTAMIMNSAQRNKRSPEIELQSDFQLEFWDATDTAMMVPVFADAQAVLDYASQSKRNGQYVLKTIMETFSSLNHRSPVEVKPPTEGNFKNDDPLYPDQIGFKVLNVLLRSLAASPQAAQLKWPRATRSLIRLLNPKKLPAVYNFGVNTSFSTQDHYVEEIMSTLHVIYASSPENAQKIRDVVIEIFKKKLESPAEIFVEAFDNHSQTQFLLKAMKEFAINSPEVLDPYLEILLNRMVTLKDETYMASISNAIVRALNLQPDQKAAEKRHFVFHRVFDQIWQGFKSGSRRLGHSAPQELAVFMAFSPENKKYFEKQIYDFVMNGESTAAVEGQYKEKVFYQDMESQISQEMPTLDLLIQDPQKMLRFVRVLTLLRLMYPYTTNLRTPQAPLSFAEQHKYFFHFGEFRIAPLSEAFRRHILYLKKGEEYWAIELKIPGEADGRQFIGREHFDVAKEQWDHYDHKSRVAKPAFFLSISIPLQVLYHDSFTFDKAPLGIAAFVYRDGKRLSNFFGRFDSLHKNRFEKLEPLEAYLKILAQKRNLSLEQLTDEMTLEGLVGANLLHRQGFQGSVPSGTDMHTENLRLIDATVETEFVDDFAVFERKQTIPADIAWREIQDLLELLDVNDRLERIFPEFLKRLLETAQNPEDAQRLLFQVSHDLMPFIKAHPETERQLKEASLIAEIEKNKKGENRSEVRKAVPGKRGYYYQFFEGWGGGERDILKFRSRLAQTGQVFREAKNATEAKRWDKALTTARNLWGTQTWLLYHRDKMIGAFALNSHLPLSVEIMAYLPSFEKAGESKEYTQMLERTIFHEKTPRGNIVISPEYQNQGFGKFLYETALTHYQETPQGPRYYFMPHTNPASFRAFYKVALKKKLPVYYLNQPTWDPKGYKHIIVDLHPKRGPVPAFFGNPLPKNIEATMKRLHWPREQKSPRIELAARSETREDEAREWIRRILAEAEKRHVFFEPADAQGLADQLNSFFVSGKAFQGASALAMGDQVILSFMEGGSIQNYALDAKGLGALLGHPLVAAYEQLVNEALKDVIKDLERLEDEQLTALIPYLQAFISTKKEFKSFISLAGTALHRVSGEPVALMFDNRYLEILSKFHQTFPMLMSFQKMLSIKEAAVVLAHQARLHPLQMRAEEMLEARFPWAKLEKEAQLRMPRTPAQHELLRYMFGAWIHGENLSQEYQFRYLKKMNLTDPAFFEPLRVAPDSHLNHIYHQMVDVILPDMRKTEFENKMAFMEYFYKGKEKLPVFRNIALQYLIRFEIEEDEQRVAEGMPAAEGPYFGALRTQKFMNFLINSKYHEAASFEALEAIRAESRDEKLKAVLTAQDLMDLWPQVAASVRLITKNSKAGNETDTRIETYAQELDAFLKLLDPSQRNYFKYIEKGQSSLLQLVQLRVLDQKPYEIKFDGDTEKGHLELVEFIPQPQTTADKLREFDKPWREIQEIEGGIRREIQWAGLEKIEAEIKPGVSFKVDLTRTGNGRGGLHESFSWSKDTGIFRFQTGLASRAIEEFSIEIETEEDPLESIRWDRPTNTLTFTWIAAVEKQLSKDRRFKVWKNKVDSILESEIQLSPEKKHFRFNVEVRSESRGNLQAIPISHLNDLAPLMKFDPEHLLYEIETLPTTKEIRQFFSRFIAVPWYRGGREAAIYGIRSLEGPRFLTLIGDEGGRTITYPEDFYQYLQKNADHVAFEMHFNMPQSLYDNVTSLGFLFASPMDFSVAARHIPQIKRYLYDPNHTAWGMTHFGYEHPPVRDDTVILKPGMRHGQFVNFGGYAGGWLSLGSEPDLLTDLGDFIEDFKGAIEQNPNRSILAIDQWNRWVLWEPVLLETLIDSLRSESRDFESLNAELAEFIQKDSRNEALGVTAELDSLSLTPAQKQAVYASLGFKVKTNLSQSFTTTLQKIYDLKTPDPEYKFDGISNPQHQFVLLRSEPTVIKTRVKELKTPDSATGFEGIAHPERYPHLLRNDSKIIIERANRLKKVSRRYSFKGIKKPETHVPMLSLETKTLLERVKILKTPDPKFLFKGLPNLESVPELLMAAPEDVKAAVQRLKTPDPEQGFPGMPKIEGYPKLVKHETSHPGIIKERIRKMRESKQLQMANPEHYPMLLSDSLEVMEQKARAIDAIEGLKVSYKPGVSIEKVTPRLLFANPETLKANLAIFNQHQINYVPHAPYITVATKKLKTNILLLKLWGLNPSSSPRLLFYSPSTLIMNARLRYELGLPIRKSRDLEYSTQKLIQFIRQKKIESSLGPEETEQILKKWEAHEWTSKRMSQRQKIAHFSALLEGDNAELKKLIEEEYEIAKRTLAVEVTETKRNQIETFLKLFDFDTEVEIRAKWQRFERILIAQFGRSLQARLSMDENDLVQHVQMLILENREEWVEAFAAYPISPEAFLMTRMQNNLKDILNKSRSQKAGGKTTVYREADLYEDSNILESQEGRSSEELPEIKELLEKMKEFLNDNQYRFLIALLQTEGNAAAAARLAGLSVTSWTGSKFRLSIAPKIREHMPDLKESLLLKFTPRSETRKTSHVKLVLSRHGNQPQWDSKNEDYVKRTVELFKQQLQEANLSPNEPVEIWLEMIHHPVISAIRFNKQAAFIMNTFTSFWGLSESELGLLFLTPGKSTGIAAFEEFIRSERERLAPFLDIGNDLLQNDPYSHVLVKELLKLLGDRTVTVHFENTPDEVAVDYLRSDYAFKYALRDFLQGSREQSLHYYFWKNLYELRGAQLRDKHSVDEIVQYTEENPNRVNWVFRGTEHILFKNYFEKKGVSFEDISDHALETPSIFISDYFRMYLRKKEGVGLDYEQKINPKYVLTPEERRFTILGLMVEFLAYSFNSQEIALDSGHPVVEAAREKIARLSDADLEAWLKEMPKKLKVDWPDLWQEAISIGSSTEVWLSSRLESRAEVAASIVAALDPRKQKPLRAELRTIRAFVVEDVEALILEIEKIAKLKLEENISISPVSKIARMQSVELLKFLKTRKWQDGKILLALHGVKQNSFVAQLLDVLGEQSQKAEFFYDEASKPFIRRQIDEAQLTKQISATRLETTDLEKGIDELRAEGQPDIPFAFFGEEIAELSDSFVGVTLDKTSDPDLQFHNELLLTTILVLMADIIKGKEYQNQIRTLINQHPGEAKRIKSEALKAALAQQLAQLGYSEKIFSGNKLNFLALDNTAIENLLQEIENLTATLKSA